MYELMIHRLLDDCSVFGRVALVAPLVIDSALACPCTPPPTFQRITLSILFCDRNQGSKHVPCYEFLEDVTERPFRPSRIDATQLSSARVAFTQSCEIVCADEVRNVCWKLRPAKGARCSFVPPIVVASCTNQVEFTV